MSKEASWAVIRDKLSLGENQATHMLIGMPLASTMGLAGSPVKPMVAPWLLNRNGQAITLNNKLKAAGVKDRWHVHYLANRGSCCSMNRSRSSIRCPADRLVLMTDGPEATVGEIMTVPFPRPRTRGAVLDHPDYDKARRHVIDFLDHHAQQMRSSALDEVIRKRSH